MGLISTLLLAAASASQSTPPPTAQELGYPPGCTAICGGTAGNVHLIKVNCPALDLPKPPETQGETSTASDGDIAHILLFPGLWSVAVSTWQARPVDRRDVRAVSCVGLEAKRMLCSWKQRLSGSWRTYSAWTDLSNDREPRILEVLKPQD